MVRLSIYFILLLSLVVVPPAHAASLQLEPVSLTIRSGEEFNVTVNMGLLENEKALSTDVYLSYDPTLFEVVNTDNTYSISPGQIFSQNGHQVQAGSIYLFGLVEDESKATQISGTVATIRFRALQEGNGQISFSCQPNNPISSKILGTAVNNIIDCPTTLTSQTDLTVIASGAVLGASDNTTTRVQTRPRPLIQAAVIIALISLVVLTFASKKRKQSV